MFHKMRRAKQELPQATCQKILSQEKRGVLSVIGDQGYPYGIPMNFVYDPTEQMLYFHCAKEGHKLDAIRRNAKVCFTTWAIDHPDEDGWSFHVASVIAMGYATLISDAESIRELAYKLGEKYFPTIEHIEQTLQKHVSKIFIIAVKIEHMTEKLVHEK